MIKYFSLCGIIVFAGLFLTACAEPAAVKKDAWQPPPMRIDGRSFMRDHEIGDFYVQQVSCTDISTPEDRAVFDAMKQEAQPYGDLYLVARIDPILAITRKLARDGNLTGLWAFSGLKHELMIIENRHDEKGKRSGMIRAVEKRDMIVLLTYAFIADSLAKSERSKRFSFIHEIERNDGSIKIPPAWIKEAKANAAKWRKHCGKQ